IIRPLKAARDIEGHSSGRDAPLSRDLVRESLRLKSLEVKQMIVLQRYHRNVTIFCIRGRPRNPNSAILWRGFDLRDSAINSGVCRLLPLVRDNVATRPAYFAWRVRSQPDFRRPLEASRRCER